MDPENLQASVEFDEEMEKALELPTFKGYTIDVKLRQFRKVSHGEQPNIDFIDFDSERGRQLLKEVRECFSFILDK